VVQERKRAIAYLVKIIAARTTIWTVRWNFGNQKKDEKSFGALVSSERFKDKIKPMGKASEAVHLGIRSYVRPAW
jgi:hypothetical protein